MKDERMSESDTTPHYKCEASTRGRMWQPESYVDFYNIYPYRAKRRYFQKHLFEKTGSLLEVGSSAGRITKIVSKTEFVVGIDIILEYCKASKSFNPESEFICCDVRYLPFKDHSFERCLCSEVVEHIESKYTDITISEMHRVAQTILLTTPFRNLFTLFYYMLRDMLKIKHIPYDGHISVYGYHYWDKFNTIYYGFLGYDFVSKLLEKNRLFLNFMEFIDAILEKMFINKLFGTNVFVIIKASKRLAKAKNEIKKIRWLHRNGRGQ